ncbi:MULTISPECIES: TonB-dependent receptor domain-containing protein [unclassified Pseudoalteromonas]|uniref:TonB-dependent receptor domain-containing protein n=1 Tax=unclassified Pseudoalteromonas TaxID=194690 RepID=UPI000ABCD579|nr:MULTISPECIES: TonB-dependent receptor [unclassified Pseudoalteromonas]
MKMKQSALFIAMCSAIYGTPLAAEEEAKTDRKELEHIEVFGHKISLLNQDVASSISVINEKEIARKQQSELINILKDLPGVDINGSVTPLSGQPVIRGLYGERIHISVDNVKRKTESDGTSNIASINSLGVDPAQLKQVQVLRGADSLTVGSGAIGGSIRLVTKDASDYLFGENGFGALASSIYQSASDSTKFGVSLFSLTDQLDTVIHASKITFSDIDVVAKNKSDFVTPDDIEPVALLDKIKNSSERINLTLKNTWHFSPMHSLQSKLDWSDTQSIDQPYGQRQSHAINYPTLAEDYQNDYIEAMANYTYQPDSALIDLDVQLVYSKKNYQEETKGYIERRGNQISFDKISEGATKRTGIRIANLTELESFINHRLATEFNYESESFTQSEYTDDNINTYYGDSDAKSLSFSIIDQAEFFDGHLLSTAGIRYDTYKRSSNKFVDYSNNDDGSLSKELGLTIKTTDFLNFYLKYAEAFRAPSVQELYKKDEWRCHIGGKICYSEPQPNLKPETSKNYEIGFGLSWQDTLFSDYLSFKAIYFDNEIDNYINNVPFMYYINDDGDKIQGSPGPQPENGIPVATHRDYSAKNIGLLINKGVELELNYQLGKFDAYLGYSSMNMDVEGMPNFFLGSIDYQKQPYADAPADKLSINLNYQLLESLNIGGQILAYAKQDRLPEQYLNAGYGTDSYELFNLNVSYSPNGKLSGLGFVIGIDNITNERYLRAPASEANDPGELGRNFKATLSYQF